MDKKLIRTQQLAIELSISERTLRRWHAAGSGPSRVKVGRIVGYRPEFVGVWLAQHEERRRGPKRWFNPFRRPRHRIKGSGRR